MDVLHRGSRRVDMDDPLQHDALVDDGPVESDAAQGQADVAGEQQREPARQGSLPDLDDGGDHSEVLEADRQRQSGDSRPHDQDSRLASGPAHTGTPPRVTMYVRLA